MSQKLLNLALMFDQMTHHDPNAHLGFDMAESYHSRKRSIHPCGIAMCIGGWLQELYPYLRNMSLDASVFVVSLGMSFKCAEDLCYNHKAVRSTTTPQQAAQAIRNAVEFDDPKWEEILK